MNGNQSNPVVNAEGSAVDAPVRPLIQVMGRGIQTNAVEPQGRMIQGWAVEPQGIGARDQAAPASTFTIGNDAVTAPTQEPMPFSYPPASGPYYAPPSGQPAYRGAPANPYANAPGAPSPNMTTQQVARQAAARAVAQERSSRKRKGLLGAVVAIVVIIAILVPSFKAIGDAFSSIFDSGSSASSSSGSYSYSGSAFYSDEDDKAALDAVVAELDKFAADDADLQATLASMAEASFEGSGYTFEDFGTSSAAVAAWLMDDFAYEADGAYTYSDGTGTVYADLTVRSFYDLVYALIDELDKIEDVSFDNASPEDQKAMMSQAFANAMASTTETDSYYTSFDVVKQGDVWTVEPEEWKNELSYAFELY